VHLRAPLHLELSKLKLEDTKKAGRELEVLATLRSTTIKTRNALDSKTNTSFEWHDAG
jgi:hypothetical protein